jgi:hypothetical protein
MLARAISPVPDQGDIVIARGVIVCAIQEVTVIVLTKHYTINMMICMVMHGQL